MKEYIQKLTIQEMKEQLENLGLTPSEQLQNAGTKLSLLGQYIAHQENEYKPNILNISNIQAVQHWLQNVFPDIGTGYDIEFEGYFIDKQNGLMIKSASSALFELSRRYRLKDTTHRVLLPKSYTSVASLYALNCLSIDELAKLKILPVYALLVDKHNRLHKKYLRFSEEEELLPISIDLCSEEYLNIFKQMLKERSRFLSQATTP